MGRCARSSATPPVCTSTVSARRRCSIAPVHSVAALVGGDPAEVVFTGGGTESDNFALRGAAEALELAGRQHLIASAIEHEAVLQTVKALARRGWRVTPAAGRRSEGLVDTGSARGGASSRTRRSSQ